VKAWLILVGACLAALVYGSWVPPPQAAEKPLFEVDKTYSVVWDCSPAIDAYIMTPEPRQAWVAPPGCYAERLKIRAIRKDGWMEAIDLQDNTEWAFNIGQAIARKLYVPKAAA
jgi:hypothetical protein